MKNILKSLILAGLVFSLASCEDFLDRPSVDGYNVSNFYKTDEQCEQGVNYLYNSPWYDFIRGFMDVGERMSGNIYQSENAYMHLSANGTDTELVDMSRSLWAINGNVNTVIYNIHNAQGPSQAAKNKYIGEALTWKAMAYFYLVRSFGDVPIIHDNTALIKEGTYNQVHKVQKADVYEYIAMNLEKAMELLPKQTSGFNDKIRIDYYAAEALLAKVYLTKAGVSGTLNSEDLNKAKKYAKDVIDNSGRTLMTSYEDIFRLKDYNTSGECLISWMWECKSGDWTAQNSFQSDLGMTGFDEFGASWGDWTGVSVDLADQFGVSAIDDPATRKDTDIRRKATMMMPGDKYSYFWTDKGGFNFMQFLYDKDYAPNAVGGLQSATGANIVKHLFGDKADHVSALGFAPDRMSYQLPTHILRLADLYLVYAEACFLTNETGPALEYLNYVRTRAGAEALNSIDYAAIWKERRLELALEGDRWYDYVRRSYYDTQACINDLLGQRRGVWDGIADAVKKYCTDDEGKYTSSYNTWDASSVTYNGNEDLKDVKPNVFQLPMPVADVVYNPNVGTEGEVVHEDVRALYSYDF